MSERILSQLRELCGYWQDGSDTTVTIYQDDATHIFHIKVGSRDWWGNTLAEAIQTAYEDITT